MIMTSSSQTNFFISYLSCIPVSDIFTFTYRESGVRGQNVLHIDLYKTEVARICEDEMQSEREPSN